MNDFEGLLRRRLAAAEAGLPADPPASLLEYIDEVAVSHGRAHGRSAMLRRGSVSARWLALGAAAVVVAAVATQAIVNIRSAQGPGADRTWTWYATAGNPAAWGLARVANGYVTECGPSGDLKPCTSSDGVRWDVPMDPAIVSIEGARPDTGPLNVLELDGVYMSAVAPSVNDSPLIRSTDGTHWTTVASSALADWPQATFFQLGKLADRFVFVLRMGDTDPGSVFTSTNGLDWSFAGHVPGVFEDALPGSAGLYVRSASDRHAGWRTVDGVSWTAMTYTDAGLPYQPVATPEGGFVAAGSDSMAIIRSNDGLTWTADQGDLVGYPDGFAFVDGRLVVDVTTVPYPHAGIAYGPMWESLDWGKTWQPLLGSEGTQLVGAPYALADALGVIRQGKLVYMGFLDGRTIAPVPSATAEPTPTPTPPSRPVPTRLPDAVRAEWSWQKMGTTSFQAPIEVPGGYISVCSAPGTTDYLHPALCTSTDGLTWTNPAAPDSIRIEGGAPFWPIQGAHVGDAYLAFAWDRPVPSVGEPVRTLWRLTNGVWTAVPAAALDGGRPSGLGILGGKFVTIATAPDGKSASVLASSDGVAWSKLSDAPVVPNGWSVTALGIFIGGDLATGSPATWISQDGVGWVTPQLPAGVRELGGDPVLLSDGTYVDVGFGANNGIVDGLLFSQDGSSWTERPVGLDGAIYALNGVGGRLIVTMSLGGNNERPYATWQSTDDGTTWQSVPGPDGFPLEGGPAGLYGGLEIRTTDNVPAYWVGKLSGN
jgi:hypothetical protein